MTLVCSVYSRKCSWSCSWQRPTPMPCFPGVLCRFISSTWGQVLYFASQQQVRAVVMLQRWWRRQQYLMIEVHFVMRWDCGGGCGGSRGVAMEPPLPFPSPTRKSRSRQLQEALYTNLRIPSTLSTRMHRVHARSKIQIVTRKPPPTTAC